DLVASIPNIVDVSVEFIAPSAPSVVASMDDQTVVTLDIGLDTPDDGAWYEDYLKIYRKLSGGQFELIDDNFPIETTIVDSGDSVVGWTESSVGTELISSSGKTGDTSLGLGTSGSGNGIYTKNQSIGDWSDRDALQAWLYADDASDFD